MAVLQAESRESDLLTLEEAQQIAARRWVPMDCKCRWALPGQHAAWLHGAHAD